MNIYRIREQAISKYIDEIDISEDGHNNKENVYCH